LIIFEKKVCHTRKKNLTSRAIRSSHKPLSVNDLRQNDPEGVASM